MLLGGDGDSVLRFAERFMSTADSPAAGGQLTGPMQSAFQAVDREAVNRFHKAGLASGGRDFGPPGERKNYHPGYYAAYLLDPDGNNIEAVHHGPGDRSVGSVVIRFPV